MTTFLTIFGLVYFSYGAVGLLFVAFAPDLASSRVFGRMLTGKLEPTTRNKVMMLLMTVFFGAYITFFALRNYIPGIMAMVCFMAIMTAVAREQGRARAARESGEALPGTRMD
jgi:hypothetical protein